MHLLLASSDGSPLVIAGPCWPFCLCVTMPLIVGITGSVAYFFIINDYFALVSWSVVISLSVVIIVQVVMHHRREQKDNHSMMYYAINLSHDLFAACLLVCLIAHVDSLYLRASCGFGSGLFVLCLVSRSWFDGTCDGKYGSIVPRRLAGGWSRLELHCSL
jgi:hypothetical protein